MVALAHKTLYKAVCYRCNFEGAASATKCPNCSFPVILEAENTPPGGARIEDILRSNTSRPRLPGVEREPTEAPIPIQAKARPRDEPPRTPVDDTPPPPAIARRRWQGLKVAVLCSAAVAAGVLAAVIHQGL